MSSLSTEKPLKHNGIRQTLGLRPAAGLVSDRLFLTMLFAGLPVAWMAVLSGWVQFPAEHTLMMQISILLWFPLTEELAFRGLVQGMVRNRSSGRIRCLGLSLANLAATVAFIFWHLVYQPSLFVFSLIVPSLIFGLFRDRYDSLIPSLILHIGYNGSVLAALAFMA